VFQNDNEQWQAELQQRLSEVVAKKFGALAEEVRRLQAVFQEAGASVERLAAQGGAEVSPDDLAGVREQVEQAVTEAARRSAEQSEGEVQARLDNVRAETESRVRQELEGQISELRAQLEASRQAASEAANAVPVMPLPLAGEAQSAAAPAQGAVDADALKAAVDDIDAQRQQADVLAALVRQAANFAPRVVFFVVKGGNAIGWKANGFSNGLSDETVRVLSFPAQAAPLIAAALDRQQAVQLDADGGAANAALLGQYGPPGAQATAIPLVIRGKAAAVLYADAGAESQAAVSTPAIETLMRVTGMAIELLPARRGAEQPPRPAQAEAAAPAPRGQ
jgi:dGTP triphosphohydrolase